MDKRIWLGLSTTPTLLAWLIRGFTKQRASHAWVGYYDVSLGRRMVLEATGSGFGIKTWERWQKENRRAKVWVFVPREPDTYLGGLVWLAGWLDTAYDFKGLFWFLLRRWIRRPWRSPRKLKCSEAHVRLLRHCAAPGAANLDPEASTPGDLLNYYERGAGFERANVAADLRERSGGGPAPGV